MIGAVLAAKLTTAPTLTAMSTDERDGVMLTVGFDDPAEAVPIGARFELRVAETGDPKGVLEVVVQDPESRLVHVKCVGEYSPPYWRALETRAIEDPSPPPSVELAATRIDEVSVTPGSVDLGGLSANYRRKGRSGPHALRDRSQCWPR